MRRKATDFVTSLLARWSDANTPFALRLFDSLYATQISYYGAIKDKHEVLEHYFIRSNNPGTCATVTP
jgi:hypothetical protein